MIREGMGTGTENIGLFIQSIIKLTRPKVIVEIGAGDTTIKILEALTSSINEVNYDNQLISNNLLTSRSSILKSKVYDYKPKLISIDDASGEGSSFNEIYNIVSEKFNPEIISFINKNFYDITLDEINSWGKIDLLWLDAGTLVDDVRFIMTMFDIVNEGGFILIHDPFICNLTSNNVVRYVRSPIWEEICSYSLSNDIEILSIPEENKYRQTGVGVIRKRSSFEKSVRTASFQHEMYTIGLAPIKFELQQIISFEHEKIKALNVLKDLNTRIVYANILSGHSVVITIAQTVNLELKEVSKIIKNLLKVNLIKLDDKNNLIDNANYWDTYKIASTKNRNHMEFREIVKPEILSLISQALDPNCEYNEKEISPEFVKIYNLFFFTSRFNACRFSFFM